MLGVLSVSGVIGTWAGPRSPGTAFVMAHHKVGDVGDGELGSWGFPRGGMGGLSTAIASAARSFGVEIRVDARSPASSRSACCGSRCRRARLLADGRPHGAPEDAFLDLASIATTCRPSSCATSSGGTRAAAR
jgi:hypothetical protein